MVVSSEAWLQRHVVSLVMVIAEPCPRLVGHPVSVQCPFGGCCVVLEAGWQRFQPDVGFIVGISLYYTGGPHLSRVKADPPFPGGAPEHLLGDGIYSGDLMSHSCW